MKEKILFWVPRTLAILAILFMLMFSMDCFGGNSTFGEQLVCFLMHNIPVLVLVLFLVVAWKREMAGGILFLLAAVAGSIYFRAFTGNPWVLIILFPSVITGILFILHHVLSKKQSN